MILPLNLSSTDAVLLALEARGIVAMQLAKAIAVPVKEAAEMLLTHSAKLSVAQARGVEALAGVSFVTLAMEGHYVRFADDPERLAELDEMAGIYPDIRAELVHRTPTSKMTRRSPTTASRRRAS